MNQNTGLHSNDFSLGKSRMHTKKSSKKSKTPLHHKKTSIIKKSKHGSKTSNSWIIKLNVKVDMKHYIFKG